MTLADLNGRWVRDLARERPRVFRVWEYVRNGMDVPLTARWENPLSSPTEVGWEVDNVADPEFYEFVIRNDGGGVVTSQPMGRRAPLDVVEYCIWAAFEQEKGPGDAEHLRLVLGE